MKKHVMVLTGAFLAVVLMLAGCQHEPAATLVRKAISSAVTAARASDVGALADVLTTDFVTPENDLDRRRLLGLLRLAHLRHEKISVLAGPIHTEQRGQRIVAHFTVTLGGGGGLIPRHLGVYKVQTAWRDDGSHWRCYSARWKRQL